MKHILIALFLTALSFQVAAVERKTAEQINPDELIAETQQDVSQSRDHIAFVWYIPSEYWTAGSNADTRLPGEEQEQIQQTMANLTVIAIVQGDYPPIGPVRYYDRNYLLKTVRFFRVDAEGERHPLQPYQSVTRPVRMLIGSIAPALGATIGSLGDNLQFFVFNDQTLDRKRLMDPGLPGGLIVELTGKEGRSLQAEFEFPLNSLYVPRKCPNGTPAHISWRYCPWTGKKLPE